MTSQQPVPLLHHCKAKLISISWLQHENPELLGRRLHPKHSPREMPFLQDKWQRGHGAPSWHSVLFSPDSCAQQARWLLSGPASDHTLWEQSLVHSASPGSKGESKGRDLGSRARAAPCQGGRRELAPQPPTAFPVLPPKIRGYRCVREGDKGRAARPPGIERSGAIFNPRLVRGGSGFWET